MGKQRFKIYEKKKKINKVRIWILALIIGIVIIVSLGFGYVKNKMENLELQLKISKLQNNQTINGVGVCEEKEKKISSFFKGLIENEKYSLFITFLIFLGIIYLLQIGLSLFMDLTELLALGFLSIRGFGRLIIKFRERKKENVIQKRNNN